MVLAKGRKERDKRESQYYVATYIQKAGDEAGNPCYDVLPLLPRRQITYVGQQSNSGLWERKV
jgi:hypothetical protein